MKWGEIYAGDWVCPRKPSILAGRGKPATIIIDSLPLLQVLDCKPSGQPRREPKETTQHENRERRARKTRVTMLETRTSNTAEDAQQQGTPSTAVVLYEDVLCAQPQSYVSPPKNTATRRFVDQVGFLVKWGESNPHLYSYASGETSNLEVPNTGEKLAKVPSPTVEDRGQDPPIVETNPEFPAMEKEERYESCREDMSTDTQMQEKLGNPVSET
ncbi:hypothetical protein Bca52824_018020 [Brassica carinata]|uniref:Uncharacterized protein n=1 Tax=Brassica carinata TaxID=52824 RepID=A0A8X7VN50_BRACI|nr:hypothetical protein Bca52824_018020 [Brassica carinata]